MTPKQSAIEALELRQPPGLVPAFELEFQLTEEAFGRSFHPGRDFAAGFFERPDEMKRESDRSVDAALESGKRLLDGGIDGFTLCADYCFNSGPFFSPDMFREFGTPYLARLIDGYREMGAYVIKHTDGDIMPILDQLVDCRPHGLHSLDPQARVDIAEVKRLYGDRICLCGNVNCGLMQTGTDEEVIESVRYALEHGMPNGGYIFAMSNVAFKGMPLERYELIMDVRRQLGVYGEEA